MVEVPSEAGKYIPMPVQVRYRQNDPYSVETAFKDDKGETLATWLFGRDLLLEGRLEPVGDGDVHVYPHIDERGEPVVALELISPNGEAVLHLQPADVDTVCDHMTALVPVGTEAAYFDLDDVIQKIMEEGQA